MLSISKRPARLGSSINTRAERHGDDNVTALDIPLSEIMLTAEELNALMQEPHAHNVLFDHAKGGSLIEPVFEQVPFLPLAGKIEDATVTLGFNDEELQLVPCNLKRLRLVPRVGGLTSLSCLVQCVPKLDSLVARLLERLNSDVSVSIACEGFGAQQQLPLDPGNLADDEHERDDPDESDE